jgi:hypothetical protein
MKWTVRIAMALCLLFVSERASAVSPYNFQWSCSLTACTFAANPVANVASYDWKFGDGTYGVGQNTSHTYIPAGAGFATPRVTLSYRFTNGTIRNVRCYIQYYWSGGVGGDPTPTEYSGTCEGFN